MTMKMTKVMMLAGGAAMMLASAAPLAVRQGQAAPSRSVERGKYLVDRVAMCGDCHTPMKPDGKHDAARRFQGAMIGFKPAAPVPGWAAVAPGIVPATPAREQDLVKLLEIGVKADGRPPGAPMPPYRLSHADAVAVAAYLRSLSPAAKPATK